MIYDMQKMLFFFYQFLLKQHITNFYISQFGFFRKFNFQLLLISNSSPSIMIPLTFKYSIRYKFTSQKSVNLSKNYYNILEIPKHSDKKTIKKSYLKLVKKYHPDVNPKGKAKFTDIQEAFQILSHDQSKTYYDNNSQHRGNYSSKTSYEKQNNFNKKTYSTNRKQSQKQSYKQWENLKYSNSSTKKQQNSQSNFNRYKYQQQKRKTQNKNNQNQKYSSHYQYQDESFNGQNSNESKYRRQDKQRQNQSSSNENNKYSQQYQQYNHQKQNGDKFYRQSQSQFSQKWGPEQQKMRDKMRAMKGLTSYYSMFWKKNQLRYKDVMRMNKDTLNDQQTSEGQQSESDKKLKEIVPNKIIKFYQKIIKKIDEMNPYSSNDKFHK